MREHIFGALSEKSFVFLWFGQIATQIAFNLLNFFLILHVYSLTGSNIAVSIVVVSFTIPAIFFGILAGVYVDRWNKKKVLLISNIIRGLLVLLLALFHNNLYLIYTVSFAVSVATQFFIPAETPMIPLVVRGKLLLSANALFGLGLYGSILVAFLLSGPALIFLGEVYTLLFLAVLFLIGSLFVSGITLSKKIAKKKSPLTTPKHVLMAEVRSAFSLMRRSRAISNSLFLLALSQILLLVLAVIAPGYAGQVLQISIEQFPLYFIAPAATGVFLGALLLVHFFSNASKEKMMTLGLFLSGFAMLLLPYGSKIVAREFVQIFNTSFASVFDITTLHVMVLLAFILGLANAFILVPSNTILQEQTSDELRGKMYGVLNAMVGVFSLLPILLVGSLSDLIGVDKVIVGVGITLLSVGTLRMLFDI